MTHLKQPKFQLNAKVPEKSIDTCHYWKNKDLMRCIISDEQKRKKGRPLSLANISLTEKAEKTLREYSELHIKNNNVNIFGVLQNIDHRQATDKRLPTHRQVLH